MVESDIQDCKLCFRLRGDTQRSGSTVVRQFLFLNCDYSIVPFLPAPYNHHLSFLFHWPSLNIPRQNRVANNVDGVMTRTSTTK